MFILSFLCNGANLKDLALLQYKDVNRESLVFIREKIKRTTKGDAKPIIVSITPIAKNLIEKLGVTQVSDNDFVFGIIDGTEPEEKIRAKIKQASAVYNKHLKKIGKKLEIPIKLTLGVTRHSWATRMVDLGAVEKIIGDGLGHRVSSTTSNYIGTLDSGIRKSFKKACLPCSSLAINTFTLLS